MRALFPTQQVKPFDNVSAPANGDVSESFALGGPTPDIGRDIVWETRFGSAPSAISIEFQGALNDVAGQYTALDSSTATAGEKKTVKNVKVPFIRIKHVSRTGGSGVTVEVRH